MNEKIQYWIDIAEYDLETARVMLEGRRFLYVGFMCHQVIEKALKGYYVHLYNTTPPYTHNLIHLVKQNKIYDKISAAQKMIINTLEPLNTDARYPVFKEKLLKMLSYEKCRELIHETEELFIWIKGLFLNE